MASPEGPRLAIGEGRSSPIRSSPAPTTGGVDVCGDLVDQRRLGREALRAGSTLAELAEIPLDRLVDEPFVAMRRGFLMTQVVQRLYADQPSTPSITCYVEMGKLLVADGAGVTVLPDYSLELHVQTLRTHFVPARVREMLTVLADIAAAPARAPRARSASGRASGT